MCHEHNMNVDKETDTAKKQTINRIEGWIIVLHFDEKGFQLEDLVEEYIKEKFSVY